MLNARDGREHDIVVVPSLVFISNARVNMQVECHTIVEFSRTY
jgi:hypothetical protein